MNVTRIQRSSEDFCILQTTERTQTATMRLEPGAASSDKLATHPHSDQVVLVLEGRVVAEIGHERTTLEPDHCLLIPAGTKHRFYNDSEATVFAFTVYGPPAYPAGGEDSQSELQKPS